MSLSRFDITANVPIYFYASQKEEVTLVVDASDIYFVVKFLKNNSNSRLNLLTSLSGVDMLKNHFRFCIAYELLSIVYNTRLRLKVFLSETSFVPSISNIFLNANWWEREIWDMFGLYFSGHPDLRRILTDYGFEGYPLRKDFPLSGYVEVRYDYNTRRVVIDSVDLTQGLREYSFETPW